MRDKLEILYEDDSLLAINKPAGLVVNRSRSTRTRETVQDWIEQQTWWQKIDANQTIEEYVSRSGLAHRLDKETSGVLLIVKDVKSYLSVKQQFMERRIKKIYLCLVHGEMKPKEGQIAAPIARSRVRRDQFAVVADGREARTSFVVKRMGQIEKERYSYLAVMPVTGRTHQIRVHLKYLGYPVVGDIKYLGRRLARLDYKWCGRMFLHAAELGLEHPISQLNLTIRAQLPDDLAEALKNIK